MPMDRFRREGYQPKVGDHVQLAGYRGVGECCGTIVRMNETHIWLRDEDGRMRKAFRGSQAVPVPTVEEIWGPGGLTEQIRATWSAADYRQRRTKETIEQVPAEILRLPDVVFFPDEFFEESYLW